MNHFDKTSDLLAAAHDEMATRGHSRVQFFDPDGSVCLGGSLFAALGFNRMPGVSATQWPQWRKASNALHDAIGARGQLNSWITFNANHGLNDCLDLFHEAQILTKEAGD